MRGTAAALGGDAGAAGALWAVAVAVVVLNLPFGFWRESARRFSPAWFVAVHAPVPLVVGLRFVSGIGFRWSTVPVIVAAYFLGQFLGGRLRRRLEPRA